MKPAIAYLRVSTGEQGKSGLGLAAQDEAIHRFAAANDFEIIRGFKEVETGKGADALDKRPQLADAIALAKRRRAPVIVAKLDRLSRDVEFIAHLMNHKVDFIVAALGPNVPTFMLHVLAAFAQEERRVIGERTKDALKQVLARGVTRAGKPITKLGSPTTGARNRAAAVAEAEKFRDVLEPLAAKPLRQIAATLNQQGCICPSGGPWHATTVNRMLKRLELRL